MGRIDLTVPGDKSITHRALMWAAFATGDSRITGALPAGDTRSTAHVLRALGCTIPEVTAATFSVSGVGLRGLREPAEPLDCGNSGTTARLMMGVVAGAGLRATFDGDASLRSRPMARIVDPLTAMGARFEYLEVPQRLPLRALPGSLHELEYRSPHASAQIKSALLLAGLTAATHVRVIEPYPSRDHTERMLRAVGVRVDERISGAGEHIVELEPRETIVPLELQIPGDISSAAFLVAASILGAVGPVRVRNVGVNPTRTGFLDVVRAMGASLAIENERTAGGEPVADILAEPSELRGVEIGGALMPRLIDEVPIIAVLAACASGRTTIRDASELRVKESDRLRMMAQNLTAVGATVRELDDGLIIDGGRDPLRGHVSTALDHRIAMAFGVLAAVPGNQITVDDPDVVRISFPDFWNALNDHRD